MSHPQRDKLEAPWEVEYLDGDGDKREAPREVEYLDGDFEPAGDAEEVLSRIRTRCMTCCTRCWSGWSLRKAKWTCNNAQRWSLVSQVRALLLCVCLLKRVILLCVCGVDSNGDDTNTIEVRGTLC